MKPYLRITLQVGFVFILIGSIWLIRTPIGNVVPSELTGWSGGLLWILILASVAILPIPSEPFMTETLKLYGMVGGTFINLSGAMLGAVCLYSIGRILSPSVRVLLNSVKLPVLTDGITKFLHTPRFGGLLVLQLLPLPFLLINLVLGALPDVRFQSFFLATLLAFIPYQFGWTGLYDGVLHIHHLWALSLLMVGVVGVIWSIRLVLHRRGQ